MKKVPYMNYEELTGLYTIQQVAGRFRLGVRELAAKGQQYNIRPYRDGIGRYLLDSAAIKNLHYRLYQESRCRRVI